MHSTNQVGARRVTARPHGTERLTSQRARHPSPTASGAFLVRAGPPEPPITGGTVNPKDYILIAGLLRTARSEYDDPGGACEAAIDGIAADLAGYFTATDSAFSRRRFLAATGLDRFDRACGEGRR